MTEYRVLVRTIKYFAHTEDTVARDIQESLVENGVHWLEVIEATEVD